jgi:hypothetical protein
MGSSLSAAEAGRQAHTLFVPRTLAYARERRAGEEGERFGALTGAVGAHAHTQPFPCTLAHARVRRGRAGG